MNSFEEALAKGNTIEQKVKRTLESRGWKVINRTQEKQFQNMDIDFEAAKDGYETFIEVKGDYRLAETGNICVELITNVERKHLGWINYCAAEFMFYCDSINNIAYCFKMEDLRNFLKIHADQVKRINSFDRRDCKTRVLGLVNKSRFKNYLTENQLFYQELKIA